MATPNSSTVSLKLLIDTKHQKRLNNWGGVFESSGSYAHNYVTEDHTEECPSCQRTMPSQVTYLGQPKTTGTASGAGAAGYVKGVVTYMIMDDLEVKPMSTISSITLLNRFNVKDVGALEERVVVLSMDEGVKLLKESLQSKSVLTNVFLGKKAAA
ncbi:hypothetical protein M0R45_037227 [Rubus argutus]|uniref:Uncharacterized protein n=1 Tax=Rubus argutus TaxID=59490 RepID=A0AAW1W197_RUBAR